VSTPRTTRIKTTTRIIIIIKIRIIIIIITMLQQHETNRPLWSIERVSLQAGALVNDIVGSHQPTNQPKPKKLFSE